MPAPEEGASTARVLLKEQQARLLAAAAPDLARAYEHEFARGVQALLRYGMDASLAPRRDVLWTPHAPSAAAHRHAPIDSLLPAWYAALNPVCVECAVPLLPAITGRHRTVRKARRAAYVCDACGAVQPAQRTSKPPVASVRGRRRMRKEILAGQAPAPVPHAAKDPAAAPKAPKAAHGPGALPTAQAPKEPGALPVAKTPRAPGAVPTQAARVPAAVPTKGARAPGPGAAKAPAPGAVAKGPGAAATSHTPVPAGAAPAGTARRRPNAAADHKEGLRALLQQKKASTPQPAPTRGGLADFLNQL
ncbi:hypothetical protein GLX27_003753 [Malassezia furfur]|uniref:Uncharacterized protein n=1 Tax=Malassezia furfur TaxID=55194 RepID=A0ABY8EU48_MALFU|nr:hypothetical protein GLX27_003753 [Malassezia furfur]